MSINVGNLPFEVTEQGLRDIFADYGTVSDLHFPVDLETGQKQGFAIVKMSTPEEEAASIAALNNRAEWMGRTLKLNKVRE